MKVRYDPEADALDLRLADTSVSESEEMRLGIIVDFDAEGRVVAIEILDTKAHLSPGMDLAHLSAA
ncbi:MULTISPECIES: DUF2283 domain-containing protein [unclassified Methylobacterium]|jgi:uncharacterized protein YuzE|uniref:DUF2283 domain-containing protein n=1 Tax=unclassified Methylobacterium TaxID=2615210 RepID=UPI0013553B90|nr:DUF2283 domain-containing protein [Methylobacterium sp. 2A]MWV23311.1 DUF2283 domain-containing protein [Methylobacterium sp. 2A]